LEKLKDNAKIKGDFMRWITPFGMLHLSGVYFILLFAVMFCEIIHNTEISIILALFTAIIWDTLLSVLYGLRFIRKEDYIRLDFDGYIPDCHGLFATACISAITWTYTDSTTLALIIPVIIVFMGKEIDKKFVKLIKTRMGTKNKVSLGILRRSSYKIMVFLFLNIKCRLKLPLNKQPNDKQDCN